MHTCGRDKLIYASSPFSIVHLVLQKIKQDEAEEILVVPFWKTQAWFPLFTNMIVKPSLPIDINNDELFLPFIQEDVRHTFWRDVAVHQHPLAGRLSLVIAYCSGKAYTDEDWHSQLQTLLATRRTSSNKLYTGYLQLWEKYCFTKGFDPFDPPIPHALDFLQSLIDDPETHRGYSAICTARSALSSIIFMLDGSKFEKQPLVIQFINEFSNLLPPTPRYTTIRDTSEVLNWLKSWYPAKKHSLLKLGKKIVMLILVITGQGEQTLLALNTRDMIILQNKYIFKDTKYGH